MSKVALFFKERHKVFKNKAQGCSTPLRPERLLKMEKQNKTKADSFHLSAVTFIG